MRLFRKYIICVPKIKWQNWKRHFCVYLRIETKSNSKSEMQNSIIRVMCFCSPQNDFIYIYTISIPLADVAMTVCECVFLALFLCDTMMWWWWWCGATIKIGSWNQQTIRFTNEISLKGTKTNMKIVQHQNQLPAEKITRTRITARKKKYKKRENRTGTVAS